MKASEAGGVLLFRTDTRDPATIFKTGFEGQFAKDRTESVEIIGMGQLELTGSDITRRHFQDYFEALARARRTAASKASHHVRRGALARAHLGAMPIVKSGSALSYGDIDHSAHGAVCLSTRLGANASWTLLRTIIDGVVPYVYLAFVPYGYIVKISSIMAKAYDAQTGSGQASALAMMWEVATARVMPNSVLLAFQVECVALSPNPKPTNRKDLFALYRTGKLGWRIDEGFAPVQNVDGLAALALKTTVGKRGAEHAWRPVATALGKLGTADALKDVTLKNFAAEWPNLPNAAAALTPTATKDKAYLRCTPAGDGTAVKIAETAWDVQAVPPILALPDPAATASPTAPSTTATRSGPPILTSGIM